MCTMNKAKRIDSVEKDSIAEELGIETGDAVVAVNGKEVGDILDWQMATAGEELTLTVLHRDGSVTEFEIEKEYDEDLGLVFASPTLDKIRSCANRCLFCFVDQQPPGMRDTLYIKDDDYRLSFLTGSYITLTNLTKKDLARIKSLHISPLYVSVHATDPALRQKLMGNPRAGRVLSTMKELAEAGIEFHTQAVLCPGINDGEALEKTIADLYGLYPSVRTLAVVPVGLTGHRENLYPLSAFDAFHARDVLRRVRRWQEKALEEKKTRFVFAADEFYHMAGQPVPADHEYEGYPQLENGVGLVRLLLNEWERRQYRLPESIDKPKNVTLVTGVSAFSYLEQVVKKLNAVKGLNATLLPVKNNFFGGHVTVAGLLTYTDILPALSAQGDSSPVFLPRVMLKKGTDLFLDGHNIGELASKINREVFIADGLGDVIDYLLDSEER